MFLRSQIRKKDGKSHTYWSVVENKRLHDGRILQRQVLYLGEVNDSQREAWRKTLDAFVEGEDTPRQIALFPHDRPSPIDDSRVVQIRLRDLTLHRPRQWGGCWLALELYQQLGFDTFFAEHLPASRKGTAWDRILQVLVTYRLIAPGSEPSGARQTATQEQPRRGKPPVRRRINGISTANGSSARLSPTCSAATSDSPGSTAFTNASTTSSRSKTSSSLIFANAGAISLAQSTTSFSTI